MLAVDWHGCYDGNWRGLIVPKAYAHPAKFAPGLVARILDHGLEMEWWNPGDLLGDPFAGIGCGGIMCAFRGLRWVGVEMEEKFVDLAHRNFALHTHKWRGVGLPLPLIVQGDSREFAGIVGGLSAAVTSPPFASVEPCQDRTFRINDGRKAPPQGQDGYGSSPGQIGNMPAGTVDAVVTSPPWGGEYGNAEGGNQICKGRVGKPGDLTAGKTVLGGGHAPGQIGNSAGTTYWQAVAEVYAQCALALKPGGIMAVVIKDYVKKGNRVPLCDQTLELLTRLGFEPVERIRAWLVEERRTSGLFGEIVRRKERKSFFRRLAEKKGSPRIDWEEVLVVRNQEAGSGGV